MAQHLSVLFLLFVLLFCSSCNTQSLDPYVVAQISTPEEAVCIVVDGPTVYYVTASAIYEVLFAPDENGVWSGTNVNETRIGYVSAFSRAWIHQLSLGLICTKSRVPFVVISQVHWKKAHWRRKKYCSERYHRVLWKPFQSTGQTLGQPQVLHHSPHLGTNWEVPIEIKQVNSKLKQN